MAVSKTIAIFREAVKKLISSYNHIFNTQEETNKNKKNNPNYLKENTLIYFEGDNVIKENYIRDGNNQHLIDKFKAIEEKIDKLARADYTAHKLEEKAENPSKKIRTKLQTKDLRKEFGIFLGGDKDIGNKQDFEEKAIKTIQRIMKKKGLSDKNIISITIHYDEKTPHIHCQYNDYSFDKHTTGAELQRIRTDKNASNEEKEYAYKLQKQNFARLQDITADGMGMLRGQKNSRQVNKSKYDYYNEVKNNKDYDVIKELAMTKKALDETIQQNSELCNLIDDMNKQDEKLRIDYYNKNGEVNDLQNTIAELKESSKNLKELAELFEVLGLDKISKEIKEVKETLENKPSFLDSIKKLIDNFIHLLNVRQEEKTRVLLSLEKFKTKEPEPEKPTENKQISFNRFKKDNQFDIG